MIKYVTIAQGEYTAKSTLAKEAGVRQRLIRSHVAAGHLKEIILNTENLKRGRVRIIAKEEAERYLRWLKEHREQQA